MSDYLAGEFNDIEKLFISKIELDADSEYTDENGKRFLSDNLHVLPVGTIPPNPTELLLNARLDNCWRRCVLGTIIFSLIVPLSTSWRILRSLDNMPTTLFL